MHHRPSLLVITYLRLHPPPQTPATSTFGPVVLPNQTLTTVLFTFLGEKLSAVLPSSDNFAWYLPKELHDQSDVVCPPPHTSQRGQARFSITACTHTSAQLALGLTHTLLPRAASWTDNEGSSIPRIPLNPSHIKFTWGSDWLLVSMFARVRHPCVPVPPALSPALPLLLKNSREYFPERAKCLGIQPSSSMMWAIWSIKGGGVRGKSRDRKKEEKTQRQEKSRHKRDKIKRFTEEKEGVLGQEITDNREI